MIHPLTVSVLLATASTAFSQSFLQPAFTSEDLSPNSERFGQEISPRDYLQRITVVYFGAEW